MTYTQSKKQAAPRRPKTLAAKGFESSNYDMFRELKETTFKELKGSMVTVLHQVQNTNKELEMI